MYCLAAGCDKNFNFVIFLDAVNLTKLMSNARLGKMVVLAELYQCIQHFKVTVALNSCGILKLYIWVCFCPVQIKLCR